MEELFIAHKDIFENLEVVYLSACVYAIADVVWKFFDAQQQALDDRETLSEMRALVYGEGW